MGNQNSSIPSHTRPLQEEAGSAEPRRKLVIGNDSPMPSYGAINVVDKVSPGTSKKGSKSNDHTLIKPVQVQQEGKHGQNQLVIPVNNAGSVYTTETPTNVPMTTIVCRVLCASLVAFILLIFLGLLFTVAFDPSKYSLSPSLPRESSELPYPIPVLIEEVNPFWYKTITATNPKPVLVDIHLGVVDCEALVYDNQTTVSDRHYTRTVTTDSYQQLSQHIVPYSYLLKGSRVLITFNITSSPVVHGKNASLLRFDSFTEYSKLSDQSTASSARYVEEIQLNSTVGSYNEVVINSDKNGVQLFGLKTPSGFKVTYNFTIFMVYLNDSLDYQCILVGHEKNCEIEMNNTESLHSKTCLVGKCVSLGSSAEDFYQLEVSIYRRYMNWVMCSLIALVVSFFIIFIAIGTYDCMRKKIYPVGKKAVSLPFHRRRERV